MVMCLKILQSFKALEITDWTSVLHSCRTIVVLSCEPLTLWVTDLVVCIFIVYLCIHAPTVSYHLNWLVCHYFLRGRLIVRLKIRSFSGRFPFKRAEITSFFSPTVVQKNHVQSQNTKPQMFFKKFWTTAVNFSFETWILFTCSAKKEWMRLHGATFHHGAWLLGSPYHPMH